MTLALILTRAREQIRSGRLPATLPSKMWADHGKGQQCAVCDLVIASDERQYEFRLPIPGGFSDHCIHFACYQAWMGCRSIAVVGPTESV
jgi:hypothetical protein